MHPFLAHLAHNVFRLVEIIKPSGQEVLSQLNYNIVGMIIGWFMIKLVDPDLQPRWPPSADVDLT